MTRNTYDKYHAPKQGKHESGIIKETEPLYKPKHMKQWYEVWRVLGPAGPLEVLPAFGLEEAKELIKGCWDWKVTTETEEIVI